MDEYEVGYGRPPKATRFKPGTSGNPKGRPKRDRSSLGEIVHAVLNEPVKYLENGRARTASRREVALKMLMQRATKGDVSAADTLLKKRADALREAGSGSHTLLIQDWLPDHPGQTAEDKNRALGYGSDSGKTVDDDTP